MIRIFLLFLIIAVTIFTLSYKNRFLEFEETGVTMYPTLEKNDVLVVLKNKYDKEAIKRGDIIVFKYPKEPERIFHKRVIGLEKEKIEIQKGITFINGQKLQEDYIIKNPLDNISKVEIPLGCVFVLGDNRKNSFDSRNWGCLPKEDIIGKVVKVRK